MAGDEGVTGPVPIDQMDPMDRAAMAQAQGHQYIDNMSTFFGSAPSPTTQGQDAQAINAVQDRANAKQQLDQAQSAGTSMQVDPEHVDKLAAFFEGEAQALEDRESQLVALSSSRRRCVGTSAWRSSSGVGGKGETSWYSWHGLVRS